MMAEYLRQFLQQAATEPGKFAIEEDGLTLTYGQVDAACDLTAQRIADAGYAPGQIVAYLGGSGIQRVVALWGAIKAGTPILPLDERQPLATLVGLVEHSGAKAVLLHDTRFGGIADALAPPVIAGPEAYPDRANVAHFCLPDVDPATTAFFRYTSGSTGRSKIVPISHRTAEQLINLADVDQEITANDRIALLGHFWPQLILAPLSVGGSIFVMIFLRVAQDRCPRGSRRTGLRL